MEHFGLCFQIPTIKLRRIIIEYYCNETFFYYCSKLVQTLIDIYKLINLDSQDQEQ